MSATAEAEATAAGGGASDSRPPDAARRRELRKMARGGAATNGKPDTKRVETSRGTVHSNAGPAEQFETLASLVAETATDELAELFEVSADILNIGFMAELIRRIPEKRNAIIKAVRSVLSEDAIRGYTSTQAHVLPAAEDDTTDQPLPDPVLDMSRAVSSPDVIVLTPDSTDTTPPTPSPATTNLFVAIAMERVHARREARTQEAVEIQSEGRAVRSRKRRSDPRRQKRNEEQDILIGGGAERVRVKPTMLMLELAERVAKTSNRAAIQLAKLTNKKKFPRLNTAALRVLRVLERQFRERQKLKEAYRSEEGRATQVAVSAHGEIGQPKHEPHSSPTAVSTQPLTTRPFQLAFSGEYVAAHESTHQGREERKMRRALARTRDLEPLLELMADGRFDLREFHAWRRRINHHIHITSRQAVRRSIEEDMELMAEGALSADEFRRRWNM